MKFFFFICFLVLFGWLGSGSSNKRISSTPYTIINHNAGILRRIKGDDNTLIKAFVEQSAKQ